MPSLSIFPITCDTCGHPIQKAEHGMLSWLDGVKVDPHDIRIVHHALHSPLGKGRCYHDKDAEFAKDKSTLADIHLDEVQGPDGLMQLLEFLMERKFDQADVAEIIKRLYVPGYDSALPHFENALDSCVIELNRPKGYYTQRQIALVLKANAAGEI